MQVRTIEKYRYLALCYELVSEAAVLRPEWIAPPFRALLAHRLQRSGDWQRDLINGCGDGAARAARDAAAAAAVEELLASGALRECEPAGEMPLGRTVLNCTSPPP